MRFSEYRRLRKEEEQDTGATSGALSMSEQKPSTGRKFTDIMKEREPQKYASMVAERNERKANNVSDYLDKVNSHLNNTYKQTSDAASYINQHKDTYTPDAGDYVTSRHGEYDQTKQQAFALMKEAWDNQDLDKDTRKQALDLLLNSVANVHQTDKTNTAFADYMNQFDNKDAFDRTRAAERKQEEAESMTVEELQRKIEETNSMLEKVEEEKKQAEANNLLKRKGIYNIWTSEGLVKPSDVTKEDVDTLDYQKKTYENDIQNYKNMIFQKEQQKALNSLTDKTKDAFEKLYALQTEGYNKDSSGLERVLDNLSDTSPQVQRAYEREEKEKAISALEEQGISSDEFESLYEYYKFARDSESNKSKVKEWNSDYENAGTLAKIGMNLGTIASAPVKGVTAAQEMVDSLHYKNDYAPLNTNSANYEFTNYVDTVRNATSQDIDNKVVNFLYQTGMSMADFGVLLPLNAVTGNAASLAIMGTNAGTSAAKEATLRGVSKEQALMTGLAAGTAEIVFEKMSLDNFWDIARKQGRAATRNAFLNIAAQAGIEGSEEFFTDIANTFTDNLINKGLSEWYQNMDSYYKQGMTMTEAQKRATYDYCMQLKDSFLGGALSGGLFGTGAVINTSLSGKQSTMVNEDFKQVAEGIDTDRSSYASQEDYEKAMEVQQLSQSLATKDKVTNFEKGLFNQVASELSNIDWNEQNNPNEQIRQISSSISNETVSRAFVADYKEGMPVDTYTRAFSLFYGAGYTDMPFKTALEKANNFTAFIDEPTLYAIHSLGQNQAEEMSKQYASAEQKELVNTMANALGVKVEYQDIPGANGMYKDGVIYISNKTINPSMVVMSHELTHELKETANEEYMAYENYVIDYFKEFHEKDYEALYSSMTEHYGNDEALIREEIAANAAETFLTDSEAVSRFVKENRTVAERISDFLSNFVNKLKELYQNYTAKGKAGKMLSEDIEVYEKARDLWYEAVKASEGENNISENSMNNEKKLSLKEYDSWDKKDPRVKFHVSNVSEPLISVGIDENREITFDSKKIIKIKSEHPEMTDDIIKNIDTIIKEPIAIMNSATVSGRITMIGELEGDNGNPVIIALELHPKNSKGIEIEEIKICTAYTKDNLYKWLKNQDFLWINPDKNKTNAWLKRTRVQFPVGINQYGLIKSIPQNQQNNNAKFSYKGLKAAENDMNSYIKALEMYEADEEEWKIFAETGWFRGADGKWRYEIDDSKATVFRHGDAAFRNNENYQKYSKMLETGDFFNPEFEKLEQIYRDIGERDHLTDYLVHDELYRAYPFLKNMKVQKTAEEDMNGYFNRFSNEIVVNESLFLPYVEEKLKSTLLHEVQHVIQQYEKFAGGATLNTWENIDISKNGEILDDFTKYRITAGEIEARDVSDRVSLDYEQRRHKLPRTEEKEGVIFAENKNNNPYIPVKFSLKSYADDIGLRFSDKEGGDLFEEIMMGTDNIDYNSVLVNDGSEAYRATMDLINESARILQEGLKAAGSLKDINVTKDMAHAMATHYLDKYSATFDEDTLADNLYNIFAYIQKSENVDYQDMIRVMQEVCKPVIATSQKIDKDMLKQYNDFRKTVKSYPLKLNEEQKAEIASVYDSFRTFKNVNQNKYTFRDSGNYLDNVWSELVEASGYALSYDTPSSEQMLALHNYMTSLEKSVVSPSEDMDNSQVAYDMALNIYTDYFKLIGEDKQAINNLRTQMQKKITEYKHDIREDYKDRFKKYKEEAELQKQDEINRLQKQIRKLEHERDDARYEADDIAVNLLDGNIEALQYKIGKISKRNAENLAKLNVNNYNRSIQRAMSKQETEIKNHIKKNMFDLQNRLAKPKDNKYIPQGLVRSTIDLCEAVNINTGKSERLAERLDDMSRLYARLKEDKDYAIASEYDENTQKMIDRLREVFKGRNITMLNMQELKEVDGLITQLRFQIVNAGKLIGMEKSKEVYDTAVRCMEEINASEGYKDTKSGRLTNKYITTSLNAKRQFRRMAGYKNDSVMEQLYADLDKGQLRQTQTLMEAARLFDPVLEGEHNQKAVRKMLGKDRNDWIDSGLVYKDQSPVIMPRSFLISLAMQIQNKSYLDHIIYGGLTVPEWDAYMRGDYTTAYTQGTTIRFMPDAKLSFEQRQQLYDEAVKKLKSAVSNMTVYDKEFKQICDKFFHEFTTEKVNEVSLQLNGYKKAVVKNYFPIKTDKNFTHAEIASLFYNSTIEGSSFLNSRTGARNPVLLEDVTQVIQRVSKSTARYYGMAIPVRNFKKIYNVTLLGYQGSTKQVIAKKWGVEGQKFIEKLLTDIESGSSNDSSKLFNKLQGNFAAATLTLNPSVTIKQAASYPTAAYTVGWDALGKAFKYVFTKSDLDTIAKYTPLLWYRNQGNSTQELADAKQSDIIGKVKDKLPYQFQNAPDTMLNWIQKMDTKTVATLWKACEFNVMDTQKNLKQGSEEFYQAVAKVFNQCVEDTQPNYTTLQRPDILRNQNTFLKSIFMFKTQPMQNFGILYDATMNLRAKENNYKNASEKERQALKADVEQARKDFARAVSSQLVAGVVFSAMTLAANALLHRMDRYRDDDDEITIKSLAEMLMSDTLSCLSGALIGGSEIYNVIYSVITQEKYYGISSPTLEMVGDLFNDFVKLTNDIADEDKKGVAKFARTTSIASDILTICGIPINNAGKIVNGIKLHIEEFFDDESGYFNTGFESTKAVQYRKLFNYLAEGDNASYQKQYEKTLQSLMYTKEQDEAEATIKSEIKSNIKDAYLDGTISYDKTITLLNELGDEEAYFTVKKWDNADDKEYSKYSELEAAVLSGIGIDEEIKELTDNGVSLKNVNQNLKDAIKQAYKNGDITREKAIRYLLAYKDDFTEDDAYWQLREWDKEDSYADDEKYSKYDDLINAVDSSNFDSVVKEYLEHGLDAKEIKQQISNYYKPLYQEAYLNKDYKKVNDIKVMLNKIRVNGRHIYASPDYLSWNEDAKKKAAEKKD